MEWVQVREKNKNIASRAKACVCQVTGEQGGGVAAQLSRNSIGGVVRAADGLVLRPGI